jgi:hypothetical protein
MLYGFCNSGIRILRVTWLFERIPNRMMGRAGSAFTNFNIFLRFGLLLLFGLPYFLKQIENAFLIMSVIVLIGLLILIFGSKKPIQGFKS